MQRHGMKVMFAAAMAFGIGVGIGGSQPAKAQAATPTHYVVQVGISGPANIDLLQFGPATLQVHRGDMITWAIGGFHNVHVGGTAPKPLVVAPEVDGKPLPQINPEVAFPYGAANGTAFTGGESNSGIIPADQPQAFSLVVDVEVGTTFSYQCDIHPGMAGNVTVVDDATEIPSPTDVKLQAGAELGGSIGAALPTYYEMYGKSMTMMSSVDGTATVQPGNDVGRAAMNLFFPYATTIKAGESVSWTIPATSIEPHTISNPATYGQEFAPIEQPAGPPILALGNTLAPMTQSGATVKSGEAWSSGLILPGTTFTLTFAEAGLYPYACNIHPGMNGVVIVE
jgi:plastocyanin